MITNSPLETLLAEVRLALAEAVPDQIQAALSFDNLVKESQERDSEGKLTEKAHRALTRLRNPFLLEETTQKTRCKILEQERKRRKQLTETFAQTVRLFAIWYEQRSKLDEIDRHQEALLPVQNSREQHDPESMFELGSPFIERLAGAGVSPSAIGRLRDDMVMCIADLIKAHSRDPHLEDPNNPWVLMVKAGILEAPARQLDEHEQRVIVHARALRSEHQDQFALKARRDLNLPEGFSQQFLLGAARISDLSRELTQGEASAYYRCLGLQRDRNVELLGQVLGLRSDHDIVKLTTLVHLFTEASHWDAEDMHGRVLLQAMKAFVDGIEPHKKLRSDWVSELLEGLPHLAEELSECVDSLEVFDRLFREGLALSEAKQRMDERKAKRKQEQEEDQFQECLCWVLGLGLPFKIDFPFAWPEGHKYFLECEADEWTCERWIAEHGYPKGYEPSSDKGRDGHLGAAEEDRRDIAPEDPTAVFEGAEFSPDDGTEPGYLEAVFEPLEEDEEWSPGAEDEGNEEIDLAACLRDDGDENDEPHRADFDRPDRLERQRIERNPGLGGTALHSSSAEAEAGDQVKHHGAKDREHRPETGDEIIPLGENRASLADHAAQASFGNAEGFSSLRMQRQSIEGHGFAEQYAPEERLDAAASLSPSERSDPRTEGKSILRSDGGPPGINPADKEADDIATLDMPHATGTATNSRSAGNGRAPDRQTSLFDFDDKDLI